MTFQTLISYKWNGRQEEKWLFWLKKELEARGFIVSLSPFPKSINSDPSDLISTIQNIYLVEDQNTYMVKHDPGCLTIMKYLENLARQKKVEPTLLVAGSEKKTPSIIAAELLLGPGKNVTSFTHLPPAHRQFFSKLFDIKLVILFSGDVNLLKNKEQLLLNAEK